MKFHKFFSLKRFGRLMAADLRLNSKRYLYILAGSFAGLYLALLFSMLSNSNHTISANHYAPMFIFSLMVLGVYVGSAFPAFSERTTTANFLLFPASSFEKLLSQFLIYFVAGVVLFLSFFWIDAHLARLSLSNIEDVRTGKWIIEPFKYSNYISIWSSSISVIIMMFFVAITLATGSFLFAARLFFGKIAVAKSVITGIILIVSGICLMVLCSHLFYPDRTQGFEIRTNEYFALGEISNFYLFAYSLCAIICLFCLPVAYFKLKEKQL